MCYVGEGGDYVLEPTYRYVGQGAGEWGKTRVPSQMCNCCLLLGSWSGILALAASVFLLYRLQTQVTTTTPMPSAAADLDDVIPFNCLRGGNWTMPKKAWCCDKFKLGCPEEQRHRSGHRGGHRSGHHDKHHDEHHGGHHSGHQVEKQSEDQRHSVWYCIDGYSNWMAAWTTHRKKFCCRHLGKGCAGLLPPSSPPNSEQQPSQAGGGGEPFRRPPAPPPVPEDGPPFNCDRDFSAWVHKWSVAKAVWCCRAAKRGCPGDAVAP